MPPEKSKELYVYTDPISKLYTDNMGRLSVHSRSGNHNIMLSYHVDTNTILVEPFQSRQDRHRIASYDRIMTRLKKCGHTVNLQILDNEASQAYKQTIQDTLVCTLQLVPLHVHQCNIAKRSIHTFKDHFLVILSVISDSLPKYLWNHLLLYTELTLNLLRQSTLAPEMSAWEHLHVPFNFDTTPLGLIGCPVVIHTKPGIRKTWDFRGRSRFNIGSALKHYRCFYDVDGATKALLFYDNVEFLNK